MSCNCNNNLSEKTAPPTGAKAVWEEYKIPICLGGAAIGGVLLYSKLGKKQKKK